MINALPDQSTILLRVGVGTNPGPVETLAFMLARRRHRIEWCVPETGRNRTGTFVRDIAMVDRADAVVAFLTDDEDPLGGSGTAHVIQKAVDVDRPLFAYAVSDEGLEWIGGTDAPQSLVKLAALFGREPRMSQNGPPNGP